MPPSLTTPPQTALAKQALIAKEEFSLGSDGSGFEHFKGKAFETVISRTVRLSEAPSFGEPIIEYAKNSNGAKQYLSLAKEVIERG